MHQAAPNPLADWETTRDPKTGPVGGAVRWRPGPYRLLTALSMVLWTSPTSGGDYGPFTYGDWVPVDPGQAGDVEYIAVHPSDPNVVICASDACGLALTCDRGESWAIVNKGLVGGADANGTLTYYNARPSDGLAWDPIDSNYVYAGVTADVFRGRLRRGHPGSVAWEWVGRIPEGWGIRDLVFDPDPDPNGVGRPQLFYVVNQYGQVSFTNDGGQHFYKVTRIPYSEQASKTWPGGPPNGVSVFAGCQNPLLRVVPTALRWCRIVWVPCPGGPMVAWMWHNQYDPAHRWFLNEDDPNYIGNWQWEDPSDPNTGLPDPNVTRATGLVIRAVGFNAYRFILACNNADGTYGGIYTREMENYAWQSPWVKRGHTFDAASRVISALTPHPYDPNICYVGTPRGDSGDPRGVVRTLNLNATDPNTTAWHTLTDPNHMVLGHDVSSRAGHTWAISICSSNPNVMFFSCDYVETCRTENGGASWTQVYTQAVDPNKGLWRHRGLNAVHTQSIVMAPGDPNIFFIGRNDKFGSFKTEDRGRSFRKFFCLDGHQPNCAPATLTYRAGGVTYTKPTSWFVYPGDSPFDPNGDPNWWVRGIESNIVSGVVHPADPNRAWFVTYDEPTRHCSLVVKTDDGARNLTIVLPADAKKPDTTFPKSRHLYLQIAADPNASRLFLAAEQEGVLLSVDGGDTWTVSLDTNDPGLVEDPNREAFVAVEVCPGDPNVVYCASGRRGLADPMRGYVYRSLDGGLTWSKLTWQPANIARLAVHPQDPNVVYAAVNDWEQDDRDGGVWRTVDGGQNWERVFPVAPGHLTALCTAVAFDPKDANTVYCLINERLANPTKVPAPGLYVRHGEGAWQNDSTGTGGYPITDLITRYCCLSLHPRTGDVYIGTSAGAFWRPRPRVLTVKVWPDDANDSGLTNSDWGRVTIEPDQAQYADGARVTLRAVPVGLYKFVRWYGDLPAEIDANTPQIVVPMEMDREIWAEFRSPFQCGSGEALLLPFGLAIMVGAAALRKHRSE